MKLIFSFFLTLFLFANCGPPGTCVPDTMARLSQYPPITNATSSAEFAKLLGTRHRGTDITKIDEVWDKLYPDHPLDILYVRNDNVAYIQKDFPVDFGVPYLWAGKHEQGDHCCLIFMDENGITLSHSQFEPGTTNYYTEQRPFAWMLTNSYRIWRVK